MNKYQYKIEGGSVKGSFNIYQARNGHIYLNMNNSVTKLSLEQIEQLGINCYSLLDYCHDDFVKAYGLPF